MTSTVLVVHASHFGSTKGIAERIAASLERSGLSVLVTPADASVDPEAFDAVVIGSAVEGGHWLPAATEYVRHHQASLARRTVWLFSSGPVGDRAVRGVQPDPRELAELRRLIAPRDHVVFAGSFDKETAAKHELSFVERNVVLRFMPDGDWRDWPLIDAWAEVIARSLGRTPVALG